MGKVSIGLRGWRFEEADVFTETGEFKPLDEIPRADRARLARLPVLLSGPCSACWLIHGDDDLDACNVPVAVYGEPLSEVALCTEHEPDFHYWFHHRDGIEYRGQDELQDAFYEWFAAGNRAPSDYEGIEHVDTDPDGVPAPSPPPTEDLELDPPTDGERIDLREFDPSATYPRRDP